jgi:hypothetical protein
LIQNGAEIKLKEEKDRNVLYTYLTWNPFPNELLVTLLIDKEAYNIDFAPKHSYKTMFQKVARYLLPEHLE